MNFAWLIGPLPEPKSQQPATPPKQEPDGDVMVQDLETPQKVEQPQAEKKGNKSTKKKDARSLKEPKGSSRSLVRVKMATVEICRKDNQK